MQAVLVTVLEDRLYAAGMSRTHLQDAVKKAGGTPGTSLNETALSKLTNGKVTAPRDGLDALVEAYGLVLGVEPLELWAEALERWREAPDVDQWISEWRAIHAARLRYRTAGIARAARKPSTPKTSLSKKT